MDGAGARGRMRWRLDMMLKGSDWSRRERTSIWNSPSWAAGSDIDIMSVETPLNNVDTTLVAEDDLPEMLAKFLSSPDRYAWPIVTRDSTRRSHFEKVSTSCIGFCIGFLAARSHKLQEPWSSNLFIHSVWPGRLTFINTLHIKHPFNHT